MSQPRWMPNFRRVPVAAPAVATNWSRTNDSGGVWVIRSVVFRLVNDANVQNRFVEVNATAGEDVWFRSGAQVAQVAGQDRFHSAYAGSGLSTADCPTYTLGWPADGLWLPPGHVLASSVANIQAGDQLSGILLQVIELPDTLPMSVLPMVTTFIENDGG